MVVVDASVLLPALVDGGARGAASREALRADNNVHVPHLLDVELASALRALVRSGKVGDDVAVEALADLTLLPIARHGHTALLPALWQVRHSMTAHDAVYVALSAALGAELLTADRRLARACSDRVPVRLVES